MPAHTMLSSVLEIIFAKMATLFNITVDKPQRRFLSELFRTVFALQGRATFTNMARFSALGERTFRRWYSRAFDWVAFNLIVVRLRAHPADRFIGVFLRQLSAQEREAHLGPGQVLLFDNETYSDGAGSLAAGRHCGGEPGGVRR